MKTFKRVTCILIFCCFSNHFTTIIAQESKKMNVLFIAVDDLKPNFNAYGNTILKSPELDKLAESGTLFYNNHCQQAVCGPSRASLMTGWMPQFTNIDGFYMPFRDMYPNAVTLPQHFKQNGYRVEAMGKIYDSRNVSINDRRDKASWDEYYRANGKGTFSKERVATESMDVPDSAYQDGAIALKAIERLGALKEMDTPFFLAVGFIKPHLPFAAPKKYWDLYDREKLPLAEFQDRAANDKGFYYNPGGELRSYNADGLSKTGDLPERTQRELIHGYYACVSFIDAQVGKVIDALKENGQYDNTIIVLWGDHGWHLGDHGQWTKHSNFEQATRSPLIIRVPGMPNNRVVKSPTSLVDMYPTLCELTGLKTPKTLHGKSLKPILEGKAERANEFVVSHYPRGGFYGDALRNDRYRYVEWKQAGQVKYIQLFDYNKDPLETVNISLLSENKKLVESLSSQLNNYLEQFKYKDNYGFENLQSHTSFPEGWAPTAVYNKGNGYITSNVENAHSGSTCLKVKVKKATQINHFGFRMINPIELKGKKPFSLSLCAKVDGVKKGKLKMNLTFYYPNSRNKKVGSQTFTIHNQYQKLEKRFTPPKSPSGEWPVRVELAVQAGEVLATYYLDDVEVSF